MQNRTFTDQLGRVISISYPPERIISLVPSQTELLFDLGLGGEIIGITKFCIHPRDKFILTTKVGGTKKLDLEKIRYLKPDLIIGNKEENEQGQIEELMGEFPVWMSDIHVLDDALEMIGNVGSLIGKEWRANELAAKIGKKFSEMQLKDEHKIKVAYFIWKDPYMLAGRRTFIDNMLSIAGFTNVTELDRYPQVDIRQICRNDPDVIFLSSEPYPFKESHILEIKKICPCAHVMLVDGELFSWYGSRLLQTPDYLTSLYDKSDPLIKI